MTHDPSKRLPQATRTEACLKLSKLVNRALGTRIDAGKIDKLFREHWSKLSLVAHQIHEAPEQPR